MSPKKSVNYHSRQSGFTLIEVCVVMVIIGIVVSIAVVLFSRFNERQNILAKAERCVDIMNYCQRYAMFNQTQIRMVLSHHGFYLEKELANNEFRTWIPVPQAQTDYHYLNFRWHAQSNKKNMITLTFQTDGSISAPLPIPFKISIYLGDSSSSYTLIIPTQGDAMIKFKGKLIEQA